jgi:hypothetical protein
MIAISPNAGIAGMIYLDAVLEFDHIPGRVAHISNGASIFKTTGVKCVDHGDFNVANFLRAAFIHWGNLLGPLLLQKQAKLIDRNDCRIVFLRQLRCIANMIAVTMRAQHHVDPIKALVFRRRSRITCHPGIDDYLLAPWSLNQKRRMS